MRAPTTNTFPEIYYTCHQSGTAGLARVEGGPIMHQDPSKLAEERAPSEGSCVAELKLFWAGQ